MQKPNVGPSKLFVIPLIIVERVLIQAFYTNMTMFTTLRCIVKTNVFDVITPNYRIHSNHPLFSEIIKCIKCNKIVSNTYESIFLGL